MSMHARTWNPPRRSPVLLAVLGLHALLFVAWPRQPAPQRDAARPVRQPTVLRLLWPAPDVVAARPAARGEPARPAMQRATPPAAREASAATPPRTGQAITLPVPGLSTSVLPPEPPASAPPRADAPLDLRLPGRGLQPVPPSPAAAALADPRANSPRPTWEARVARSLDRHVTEEMQPDGSVRTRRGDDCLVAKATRGSQLDPISEHAKTAPRSVGSCH